LPARANAPARGVDKVHARTRPPRGDRVRAWNDPVTGSCRKFQLPELPDVSGYAL